MELMEPPLELDARRRTFHTEFLFKRPKWLRDMVPSLRDCINAVAQSDDPEYFDDPEEGEFVVVDVVTKEKAWLVMPYGATPENIEWLVSSHFNAPAYRVGPKVWFV